MGSSNKVLKDAIVKGLYGVGGAVIVDAIIEFLRVPVLNDSGLFGGPSTMSNYEQISYAISGGGAVAGLIDMFTNSKPLGFSKEFVPIFIGFGIGTSLYENLIAKAIGIRNIDPYQYIYNAVPSIPLL